MKRRTPFVMSALLALVVFLPVQLTAQSKNEAVASAAKALEILQYAPDDAWRKIDPENMLFMDLPSGRIIIELRPDFAPKHVARLKELSREKFYNGIIFHRVIDGFMAQGGDPTGTGSGDSDKPNLQPEFSRDITEVEDAHFLGRDSRVSRVGFIGSIPIGAQPDSLISFVKTDKRSLWGLHCPGVMSMARTSDPTSANSQFFLMFADSRRALDQRYTVWGRIVDGIENSRRINRGEPPVRPTPIVQMRVAADVPADDQEAVEVMRTDTDIFKEYLKAIGKITENGFMQDICSVRVPSRINGEIEL